jgi:hypothetical protein
VNPESVAQLNREVQQGHTDRDFLQPNQDVGGHTLDRHVGKSDDFLTQRAPTTLSKNASTFFDLPAAESAVASALHQRSGDIDAWLSKSPTRNEPFEADVGPQRVGKVADAHGNVADSSLVRVVLNPNPHGYSIRTAYVF